MRTCRRQAVEGEGWRTVLRIYAVEVGAKETFEHSECGSQFWDLVEMYLAKSSTLACSLPRTKVLGLADHDLITMPLYPERINKRMSSVHFAS